MHNKIQNINNISNLLNTIHLDKRVVFMSGAFDLFHYGHFRAIYKASSKGDILVIQIDGNNLVKLRKGNDRPKLDQKQRAKIIASLDFVDYVFVSNLPSENATTLRKINPHTYIRPVVFGQTEVVIKAREQEIKTKLPRGRVLWLDQTLEISTTKILEGHIPMTND